MVSLMRTGAAAVMERRNEWVASLRSTLPQFTERSKAPLERGHAAAVLGCSPRRTLDDAVGCVTGSSSLLLPEKWQEQATQQLSTTLHGIVSPQQLRQTDYFLCSLIHPSYVRAGTIRCQNDTVRRRMQQEYRRTVCMPLELTMAGSKSLRLLRELTHYVEQGVAAANVSGRSRSTVAAARVNDQSDAHGPSSVPSTWPSYPLDALWPELNSADTAMFVQAFRRSRLESFVLYDKGFFDASSTAMSADGAISSEVSLAAFTALCGSIELVSGWSSLLQFADRVAREQRGLAGKVDVHA
ncbi:hypothetical protein JKF63_01941 [Porcisia hertigi]|uniref:Uncharacterized protein n=1 Tax=Porcisia hertigi TaxID=2761500 RepID=A0A836L0J6_9TRYP|nr:hypothetical protein JKF63_01941 [Porcisia hertigi]